jgi:hypothetical protein
MSRKSKAANPDQEQDDVQEAAPAVAAPEPDEAAEKLRAELGDPILIDTALQLHLVVAKKKQKELPQAEHGINFRRVGKDCHVYASDAKSAVRVVLFGDGRLVPANGCVIPAKAAKLIASADDDHAALWFHKGRVLIRVDGDSHEFRMIDVLPFAGEVGALDVFAMADSAPRRVANCRINAAQLARVQKALAVEWVELAQARKGSLLVMPEGDADSPKLGALALFNAIEE